MNEIQLTVEMRLVDRGIVKASAIVTFPNEITARDFSILKKDGEQPWVAFPSTSYVKDGKVIRNQVLEFPRSLRKQITEA